MSTVTEVMDILQAHVDDYIEKNKAMLPISIQISEENISRVKDIAGSIMRTKWNVGYPGGSFVQSVVDNNLMESFGRADTLNREALYFYCVMIRNLDMPMEVYRFKQGE